MQSEALVIAAGLAFLYFFVEATQIDSGTPEELNAKVQST